MISADADGEQRGSGAGAPVSARPSQGVARRRDDPNYWIAPVPALAQPLIRLRHLADYSGTAGRFRQAALAFRVVSAFSRDQVLAMYLDSLF
jgi:hypothetical protein